MVGLRLLIIIVISSVRCTRDSLESYSLSFHDFFSVPPLSNEAGTEARSGKNSWRVSLP